MAPAMIPSDVSFYAPEPAPERTPNAHVEERPVDVLILTALQDELEAVLALSENGRAGWHERKDEKGFRLYRRAFPNGRGAALTIAAAWSGEMGERTAAMRAQQLLDKLDPACVAMCGICAGYRQKVSLGDVIMAEQLYSYDEGKIIAAPGASAEMLHSLRTFDLQATWKMDAAYLARELDLSALAGARPPSKEAQRRWLLHTLFAHESQGGPAPAAHPDRKRACPGWTDRLREAAKADLIVVKGSSLRLTDAGREHVEEDVLHHPDGPPADPPLRIHVGAIGTGTAVQEDPKLFERLRRVVRSTLGAEMEGVAIGDVAARYKKQAIVIKAVSDHADHDKDDSFRAFACRASAEVLLAFLLKHVEPAPLREKEPIESEDDESGVDGSRGDRRLFDDRRHGFLARVERVALLRDPGAIATRHRAAAPFAGVLEIPVLRDGALVDLRIIAAVEQEITEQLVDRYQAEVERRFRQQDHLLRSTLVHSGAPAPVELAQAAWKRGVVLTSFGEYQRLCDFGPYLAKQTSRLDGDLVYPPALYVDQPARWSLAGGREEQATEAALATLWDMLEAPHPRFALVLGDFGAGKTFLLHELARRMAKDKHPLTPVLVEMSKLDKQPTIRGLLASHFANADVGRIDINAFQYLLDEGRIALLFDGFDELALRLTYDRALEHFETVVAAAKGNAKVVVTSRTQHFLTDQQVRLALATKAEQVPGYRLFQLEKFGQKQIRRFLGNLIAAPEEAEERYRLLDEVKDLLGLSENPRMLGFIAKIAPEKLRKAKERSGEITAAKLYEILIAQWLDFEFARVNPRGAPSGISRGTLRELVSKLAGVFWERNAKTLPLSDFTYLLIAEDMDPAVVEHMMASGSLLVRDAEGRFSFVHRSVMEWLVAATAAQELKEKGEAAVLGADEMSELMADFFISLAEEDQAGVWALRVGGSAGDGAAKKNAAQVRKRIERVAAAHGGVGLDVATVMELQGQDLRGQDWSRVDWRGARLDGVDLSSATLIDANLGGASLVGARLGRANLQRANLVGADLSGADLSFARLLDADLRDAKHLEASSLRGAILLGAKGVVVDGLAAVGAAPPVPGEATPRWGNTTSGSNAVTWSRSGDLLASGHEDGAVRLWDAVSRKAIWTMVGHSGPVRSIAFSPNGTTLASGSEDKTVRIRDVTTGTSLHKFSGHTETVTCVAFSPDGATLISGSYDTTVLLWDVAKATSLRTFSGHTARIWSVAFSPDGTTLASGSSDKTVRLWDVATAISLCTLSGHTAAVWDVAFSPDGGTLASGSYDKTVRLWDVATSTCLRAFSEHRGGVRSVAFSPDGTTLASGSDDRTVRLWDVATATSLSAFSGHTERVMSVAFSPDGITLASGSDDRTVRLWDVETATSLRAFAGPMNRVLSVVFSPDGKTLASGSEDKTVRLWDVATATSLRAFSGHTAAVWSVAFSRDGKTLASGSEDKTVRLWDVATATSLRAFSGHTEQVWSVVFSPDGKTLASGSEDKTVRLWDVATATSLRAFSARTPTGVTCVAFSPNGKTLATGFSDCRVRLWRAATATSLRTFSEHTNRVVSIAFSPDGKTLASGSDDRTVGLWNVATATSLHAFSQHTAGVTSVAFSADGTTLASGSRDTTVRLWDVATATSLRTFSGHTAPVASVAFSPDGTTLASASYDGTLRLWSIATGSCLAILLPRPEGWVAFTPDGRYKLGGDIGGSFWHVIGLCRFEPGELDPYLPHLRVPDADPLFRL
jgi:WD40 repeat protein/nucleoside phosphorylase